MKLIPTFYWGSCRYEVWCNYTYDVLLAWKEPLYVYDHPEDDIDFKDPHTIKDFIRLKRGDNLHEYP